MTTQTQTTRAQLADWLNRQDWRQYVASVLPVADTDGTQWAITTHLDRADGYARVLLAGLADALTHEVGAATVARDRLGRGVLLVNLY